MANTQAELLGNDIVNFIRFNSQGMVPDGWREQATADSYMQQFNQSYNDKYKAVTQYYTAGIPATGSYLEACKELGLEPRLPERIEYRIVLYPLPAAGEWDLTVWVRNHADVEHWKRDVGPDDVETLVYYTRGSHIGRPMAQWELMAARHINPTGDAETSKANIMDLDNKMQLLLDAHMARINNAMTVDALAASADEDLFA